jgi:hypothetical protein
VESCVAAAACLPKVRPCRASAHPGKGVLACPLTRTPPAREGRVRWSTKPVSVQVPRSPTSTVHLHLLVARVTGIRERAHPHDHLQVGAKQLRHHLARLLVCLLVYSLPVPLRLVPRTPHTEYVCVLWTCTDSSKQVPTWCVRTTGATLAKTLARECVVPLRHRCRCCTPCK